MNTLGELYSFLNDEKQDHVKGLAWWQSSAERNNENGVCGVGWNYFKGLGGVKRDYIKAMRYYKSAAENGCIIAYSFMGMLYHYGYGVPIDYNQALCPYKQATNDCGLA